MCVSMYLSFTKLAAMCIVCTSKLGGSSWHFEHLQHVDLAENAMFKVTYGIICLPSPPATVPDKLSMNRSKSGGFFFKMKSVYV